MKKKIGKKLTKRWFRVFVVVLAILYGYLLFKNLGQHYLWDDESNTAIFSNNLLQQGKLSAFDGRNLVAYGNGIELNSDLINTVIPPLQYYVTAASMKLFGETNFAVRFPFALMGFFCFIFFLLINIELTQKRGLILTNLLLLSTNVAFILFMRQCRYYAPTAMFFLLTTLLLIRYFKYNSLGYLLGYIVSSTLLFLSQYNAALAILATLSLAFIHLKNWNLKNKQVQYFLFGNLVIIVFVLGYFMIRNPFNTLTSYPNDGLRLDYKFYILYRSLITLDLQTFFSLPLLILFIIGNRKIMGKRSWPVKMKQLGWFLMEALALFSLFAMKPGARYMVYLAPVAFALQGYFIYQIGQWPYFHAPKIAYSVLLLLIFSSVPFISAGKKFSQSDHDHAKTVHSHFINYLKEIHSKSPSTYSVLVDYFKSKNEKDKTILIYPQFMSYPLMHYLGDQYLFMNQLNDDTKVHCKLPPYVYSNQIEPDFLVLCGPDEIKNKEEIFSKYQSTYQLDSNLNFYYIDSTRPEYRWHKFDVIKDFDRSSESIFVFKKQLTDPLNNWK